MVALGPQAAAQEVEPGPPQVIELTHPSDPVIHGWNITKIDGLSVDQSGQTDAAPAINAALQTIFDAGGGTLYLPAGKYRIDQPIVLPSGTMLRGDFVRPGTHAVDQQRNTILCAYYGRGLGQQDAPLIFIDGSSAIDGLVIWYPEQKAEAVTSYAPSIRHDTRLSAWAINGSSRNIFLVNAYTGIQLGKEGRGTCIQLMKHIYGTPLADGIEVWRDADIPRMTNINFHPDYWPDAALCDVDRTVLADHLIAQANGVTYFRTDGSELANINVRGYYRGLNLSDGHKMGNGHWLDNEGHYINLNITDCEYAVWIKNIKNHGTQFYNSVLEGRTAAVMMENPMHRSECAMFMGCTLRGGQYSIMQTWEDKPNDLFSLMFADCTFEGPIDWQGGKLVITACHFNFAGQHLTIGPQTAHAIISANTFVGKAKIMNRAPQRTHISHRPLGRAIEPPAYTYRYDRIDDYVPPSAQTQWVSAPASDADSVPAIQAAIDAVHAAGGGYVVLMPGLYNVNQQLVVKSGVELRSMHNSWQHSKFLSIFMQRDTPKSVVLMVDYAHDDPDGATILVDQDAGIDGLAFHYPGQRYSTVSKTVTETFGWLIQMRGDRSYLKHLCASNPWRFADLDTHDPDDVYIGYCVGAPLDHGIRVGESKNTFIDNVHFNSWYWNATVFANKPSPIDPEHRYKKELDNWMKAHTTAFSFAGSENVDVYGSFIFCSKDAFVLLPGEKSGVGPSGIIINSGCDWSKYGLVMYANNGVDLVNMHFIDVAKFDDDPDISSIFVGEGCTDTVRLYNMSTWGSSPRMLSMHGEDTSLVDLMNVSYQLYFEQNNRIHGGGVSIINGLRNIPRRTLGFDLDPDTARADIHATLLQQPITVTPARALRDHDAKQPASSYPPGPGLIRSLSFP